jgi:hypothetical protein
MTPVRGGLPLSVDLRSGVWARGVGGGAILVFILSRQIFSGGGVRIAARGVATVGLVLAAICLAQDATGGGKMYWRWKPLSEGAPPFGPFVNRNHFATWVVIAVPMCLGYLLAHASAHKHHHSTVIETWHKRLLQLMDARSIWLGASICLMLVALVASQSRAGMAGLVAAIVLRVSAGHESGLAESDVGHRGDRPCGRRGRDPGQPRGRLPSLRHGRGSGDRSVGDLARDVAGRERFLADGDGGWYV